MNILVVDDNEEILDILSHHLHKQGYKVYEAKNADDALSIVHQSTIDLAILDIMMPNRDGYALCRDIRKKYFFPILFLTAKSNEADKVAGFSSGADDYMLKPFSAAELTARVLSLIRRSTVYNTVGFSSLHNAQRQHRLNNLLLDESSGTVTVCDQPLDLTTLEYKLLLFLLQHRGKSLNVEFIFREVWNEVFLQTSKNTVVVHIRNIRKKIARFDPDTEYIHTVRGTGYEIY